MDKKREFLDLYNRLDRFLQSKLKVNYHVNLISYYEETLPEKKQSELKTIREFKNTHFSHSVSVRGAVPDVPQEYIDWLRDELNYVKRNYIRIVGKIQSCLDHKNRNKRIDKKPSLLTYADYYKAAYGASLPSSGSRELSVFGENIRKELRKLRILSGATYDDLVIACFNSVCSYSQGDFTGLYIDFGCGHLEEKTFKRKEKLNKARQELAETIVASLKQYELDELMK